MMRATALICGLLVTGCTLYSLPRFTVENINESDPCQVLSSEFEVNASMWEACCGNGTCVFTWPQETYHPPQPIGMVGP